MNKNYQELLTILEQNAALIKDSEVDVLLKKSPDGQEGCLDPRVQYMKNLTAMDFNDGHVTEDIILKNKQYIIPDNSKAEDYIFKGVPVGMMRAQMGWYNVDITKGKINTKEQIIEGKNGPVPIRIYTPDQVTKPGSCLIFLHGGGFVGGSTDVVENPCKAIAERANAVVVNVDYRLAPEHPYPQGAEDCFAAVSWVYKNAESILADRHKIGVAGDSAGGNLAAVCALMDRDLGTHMLAYQALLYPTLTRSNDKSVNGFEWNMDSYANALRDSQIAGCLTWMRDSVDSLNSIYMKETDSVTDSYISPLLAASMKKLPKTLIVTAEYDYLRIECTEYTKRLAAAGVEVRQVRYGGMDHAFLDKLGLYPQAEDCINEIVGDLIKL